MRLLLKIEVTFASAFFGFCLLLLSSSAYADFDAGKRAYDKGDYATAWHEFRTSQTDPRANYFLGMMAERGQGITKDFRLAAQYYETAMRAGNPFAMIRLGGLYDRGDGVSRNGYFTQKLYTLAANGAITSADNNAAARTANIVAKNNLAYLWARQNGLLDEALCLSAETLVAQPHSAAYLDTYGFILLRMNRLDDAERFIRKAIQEKSSSGILEHMGDLAQLRGDNAVAKDWWQRALTASTRDRDTTRLRSKISGGPNDFDAHPSFKLENSGFGKDCPMPTA